MPRTKLNKKVTNKRNRNSTVDDLRANAMGDVDRGKKKNEITENATINEYTVFSGINHLTFFVLFYARRNGNDAHRI